ncbi:TnsA endonuclease C-terminal domain-containing protein [Morganella psychrotolerans]|uniref:TnsA endonuclease C-terminal domain-containing protein n=1 Tax=Morganella psychrotolerans TaxID=368603 RepID=UPI00192E6763|nr:TnsA endonuclease C-terminal domain-containing protein [Morganella psychrotolerans]
MLTFEHISAYFVQHPERKLVDLCKSFDRAYQQELGQSLYDIRLMCAARLVTFDIRLPFHSLSGQRLQEVPLAVMHKRLKNV